MRRDWDIHIVRPTAEEVEAGRNPFRENMADAHTHGLDKYGSKELQIVLPLEPGLIGYILNTVGGQIRDGLVLNDGMLIGGLFEGDVKLKVYETADVFRLILPDTKFRFPEESDEDPYCLQYMSPYLSKYN